jgi:hypothetical protein
MESEINSIHANGTWDVLRIKLNVGKKKRLNQPWAGSV